MFTGIVEEVGKIKNIGKGKLQIAARKVLEDAKIGDSIAVNGICLTVTDFQPDWFRADVMPETIRRTSLGELRIGSPVNLERALSPGGRLGGHIVSGHIDGTGRIVTLTEEGNAVLMRVSTDKKLLKYIIEKGSVALDGISLTVAEVTERDFTVSLIPHTRESTNLAAKRLGSMVNIENDIVGKYVERLLPGGDKLPTSSTEAGKITMEMLHNSGF